MNQIIAIINQIIVTSMLGSTSCCNIQVLPGVNVCYEYAGVCIQPAERIYCPSGGELVTPYCTYKKGYFVDTCCDRAV